MDLPEIALQCLYSCHLAQHIDKWRVLVDMTMNLQGPQKIGSGLVI
jgi:hypothetical protein